MEPNELAERRDRLPEAMREVGADREAEDIAGLIADLPITQRRVLTLRFVSDYATGDIADVLGMTPDAVRHAQHRALRSLARSMSREAERIS